MFLLSLFQSGNSNRRKLTRICILLFISAALLFTGCPMGDVNGDNDQDAELNPNLIGRWVSEWGDGYIVEANTIINISSSGATAPIGAIKHINNFTANAGVIIVQYHPSWRPRYYSGGMEGWGNPENLLPLRGTFNGIYFRNLIPGVSVQMGGAFIEGGAEKATLAEAIAAFTLGNEGRYMALYGTFLWDAD